MSNEMIPSESATRPVDALAKALDEYKITTPAILSISSCFITLIAEFIMMLLTTNKPSSLGLSDLLILIYVMGPVAVLFAIAWVTRRTRKNAWALTLVIVAILSWGLWTMGEHTYQFLSDPEYRKLQAIGIFAVPLGQWLASGSLAAGAIFARQRQGLGNE
ncbi:hypothetical protein NZK35_18890 [Stieleria sp. ICT_E10.1]|uniref:hypothetical protein n=1 Tax=Stieleria sedimenti TaxID=2976331 RepID=UPI00217FE29F|nr:hypothetical protein [Stieleria sedimenti]MCS7468725.1 hypothetical protein [Stieleria sedimenti]